jgi:hypothetical protein
MPNLYCISKVPSTTHINPNMNLYVVKHMFIVQPSSKCLNPYIFETDEEFENHVA